MGPIVTAGGLSLARWPRSHHEAQAQARTPVSQRCTVVTRHSSPQPAAGQSQSLTYLPLHVAE